MTKIQSFILIHQFKRELNVKYAKTILKRVFRYFYKKGFSYYFGKKNIFHFLFHYRISHHECTAFYVA